MVEYSKSLNDITDIRKTDDRNEPLTKLEMKLNRKITGKIAWLTNSTRTDLCYQALQMSKKNQGATISDLRDVNSLETSKGEGEQDKIRISWRLE